MTTFTTDLCSSRRSRWTYADSGTSKTPLSSLCINEVLCVVVWWWEESERATAQGEGHDSLERREQGGR